MSRFLRGCGYALGAAAATAFCWSYFGAAVPLPGWGAATSAAFAQAAPEPELKFDVYAAGCLKDLEEVGKIHFPPVLQCADGPILPITHGGIAIAAAVPADSVNFTDATTCDRPPLLDISGGGIGQCVPNARLQVRKVRQDGVSDEKNWPRYALLCRNYKFRSLEQEESVPEYDDVAMIIHSPVNKKTCFFQRFADTALFFQPIESSAFDALDAISGENIPSPFEAGGTAFWDKPSVVKDINCARCHDANPFVRSPYAHQVTMGANALPPRKPGEAYGIAWLDHFGDEWKQFHAFFDIKQTGPGEPGACLTCHSLGPGFSTGTFLDYSAGTLAPGQFDTGNFADTHWMPPGANVTNWATRYDESLKALRACNADPDKVGCEKTSLH